jgi:hypothetical protein
MRGGADGCSGAVGMPLFRIFDRGWAVKVREE